MAPTAIATRSSGKFGIDKVAKLGSFRRNSPFFSYRLCFVGLRGPTPGPPPFSSMKSTPEVLMLMDFQVGSSCSFVASSKMGSFRKNSLQLTASALLAFEDVRLVRHRSHR
jgi:hypothetical protein